MDKEKRLYCIERAVADTYHTLKLGDFGEDYFNKDSICYMHGYVVKTTTEDGHVVKFELNPQYIMGVEGRGLTITAKGDKGARTHEDDMDGLKHVMAYTLAMAKSFLIDGCIYTGSDGRKYHTQTIRVLNSDRPDTLYFVSDFDEERMSVDVGWSYQIELIEDDSQMVYGRFERDGETVTIRPCDKLENSI